MKKLMLLLAFLPLIANAINCPKNIEVKITCIQNNVKNVVYVDDIPTEYNVAFPECKIRRNTLLRDTEGNFKITYITKDLCGINNFKQDIKVRFSTGRNWFFFTWLKDIPRLWEYTPESKKFN